MTGRVLIRQSDRADVLRINWAHLGPADTVRLETSLGQTVAEISLTPQRAHVRLGDGREFEAADDASLAREVVGVPVPLRRFAGWLRAEPGAGATGVLYDDAGRVSAMGEAGWQLNYSGYGALEAVPGPSLIEARKEDVVVRVKIETWSRGSDE
ncbi:hypothetical protein GCM10025771_18130 [Niveibacterium umoris]